MKDANYLQLSHLVSEFMQGSKGKVMHLLFPSLLTPSLFSQMRISKQKRPPSVNHLLKESLFYSVHHRSLSHTLTLFHPVLHDLILYYTLSWIFFFCAFLLTRPLLWKRLGAVGISSIWYASSHLISRQFHRLHNSSGFRSFYLAHSYHLWPWTNYFNIMSNLIYLTAYQRDIVHYIRYFIHQHRIGLFCVLMGCFSSQFD
jgi:hypothetical protein